MEAWDTPEPYNELMKLIPYKRIGESRTSAAPPCGSRPTTPTTCTATTLFVDGGMTLYPGFETGG